MIALITIAVLAVFLGKYVYLTFQFKSKILETMEELGIRISKHDVLIQRLQEKTMGEDFK